MRTRITKRTVDSLIPDGRDLFVWDTEIRGFGLKVTASGAKVFIYQFRLGGRGTSTQRIKIGNYGAWTPDEARVEAKAIERLVDQGIDPVKHRKNAVAAAQRAATAEADTVRALVPVFINEEYTLRGKASGTEVERIFEKYVFPRIGDHRVATVSRDDVEAILDALVRRKVPIMANRTLSALRRFFRWLKRKKQKISTNPTEDLDPPGQETDRDRVLSDEEIKLIWRATEIMGTPYSQFIRMLFYTAQRRDEVAGMRDSEIEQKDAIWSLPKERSKNRQAHLVPLPKQALELWEALSQFEATDLRFTTTGKTPISGFSQFKTKLDKTVLELMKHDAAARGDNPAKVQPLPQWQIHDIRRTVRTGMARLGVPENIAERILNHAPYYARRKKNISLVYNRYEYLEERRHAIKTWADWLSSLVSGLGAASGKQGKERVSAAE